MHSNGNSFKIQTESGFFKINTTYGHPLRTHLSSMRLHDRFLPYLVKNTKSGVIDIGSNIGDTLVLIKSKIDCKVCCIEPDSNFNRILRKNIYDNNLDNVLLYPYAISSFKKKIQIVKNKNLSSGNITDSENGISTKYISDVFYDLNLNINDYKTIKVDTDGFDWDVLNSINDFCKNNHNNFDYIFYEHQTYLNNIGPNDEKRNWRENQYLKSLLALRKQGFMNYYIFDNFGAFILKTTDLNCLSQLVSYPKNTLMNRMTFNFCDILICRDENILQVEKVLEDYISNDMKVVK